MIRFFGLFVFCNAEMTFCKCGYCVCHNTYCVVSRRCRGERQKRKEVDCIIKSYFYQHFIYSSKQATTR